MNACTQPYTVSFVDTLLVANADTDLTGDIVGYSDISYTAALSTDASAINIECDNPINYTYYRYVITKHLKSDITAAKINIRNAVMAKLAGIDGAAAVTASVIADYAYESINFSYTGNTFAISKAPNSTRPPTQVSGVMDLIETNTRVPLVTFSKYASCTGYGLTKSTPDDSGAADPASPQSDYGINKYTVEMIDDLIFLEGEQLEPGDYSFVSWNIYRIPSGLIMNRKPIPLTAR